MPHPIPPRCSDLGAHIDNFIAVGAHTVVVPAEGKTDGVITGPQADVIAAAYHAAELAVRLIKPGNTNAKARVCGGARVSTPHAPCTALTRSPRRRR
jgi:hypothetical protein